MVQVFLFRHGETDWNKADQFQGRTDIPLNELGIQQAETLRELVLQAQPELILSSDLVRARKTAEIANTDLGAPISFHSELQECHLGKAEGLHRLKVIEIFSQEYKHWRSNDPQSLDVGFPGGETKRQLRNRIVHFLENYLLGKPNLQRIAVSSHGGLLRQLLTHASGTPEHLFPIKNCAFHELAFERNSRAWAFRR